ncbi:MAG TPA: ABC transporter permease, partial [Gemmatimonadaceae bacterium]|nr:ABC transporter permease [Gemmatimonadaceae bacterium]
MRLLDWFTRLRERRTAELADELQTHLEMAERDRVARGELPRDAADNARREFGNVGLVQEVARDEWNGAGLAVERLGQDLKFALRILRRAPGFASLGIVTIAIGVGASTAMFSVVQATLIHPLPYAHPEQLVRVEDDLLGIGARDAGMSTPEWHDLQRSGIFTHIAPAWFDNNNLTGLSHPQRVALQIVAPDFFTLLGVQPQLGASFDPADRTPGFNGQAVISDALWNSSFGADPRVLGRVVQLDSDSYRIVGVMPRGFQPPARVAEERRTDVWVAFGFAGAPLSEATVISRSSLFPGAIARIAAGLTIADAQRRVDAFVRSLRREYPADYPPRSDWRVRLVPLKDFVVGDVRQPLVFLLGAVGLVLLVGCANVANLLLARATTRGREMAVRQALGGAPSRLMRQLLTESVVLSVLGGMVGIALVIAAKSALVRLIPDTVPRVTDITIDWGVLVFAFLASLAAGALFGLAPVLHIRGLDVTRVLKLEGRGSTSSRDQQRTRQLLVIGEVALSLVLLSTAGLLVRSFWSLLQVPLGFDPNNVTVVRTRLPYPNEVKEDLYPTAGAAATFVRDVVRRTRELPGVEAVALGSGAAVPLDHPYQDQTVMRVRIEGDVSHGDQPLLLTGSEVTPEYFHLLGMSLVRGRSFEEFDTGDKPSVAVINESMARRYWPRGDALGKRVKIGRAAPTWTTIVGIVADARTDSLAAAGEPHIYTSLYQDEGKHLAIFLKGRFEIGGIERAVRAQVQAVNSALPVFGAERLSDVVSDSLAMRRFAMMLIAVFALTAVFLAAIGVYGVISCMVSERTHEIGLRLALGADRADVMRMVMRQGARLAIAGAVVGVIGA